ncbi:MAG: energy-coupling factor transporter ATPase [Oscillospiraceae bacterium]|nr:energy-coupling factor transporter ATPase [Oscillospiraceae bacterium]
MEEAIIETRELRHSFSAGESEPTIEVLHGVDLKINRGSFVAIIGHNGSGKSTLAKHFNAIYLPDVGKVWVSGIDTSDESRTLEIRKTVGMVFQNPDNQIVANVVEEDVAFAPENLGVKSEEIRRRVDDALNVVEMYHMRTHSPHLLSGGQKQRIAIAGVIAMQPDCIVLDEPTAMLDPYGRKEIIKTVYTLNRQFGITVVLITHHMNEVTGADRVIVMDKGSVFLDGTPSEIFSHVEELRGVNLDVPAPVALMYELRRAGVDVPLDALEPERCAEVLAALMKNVKTDGTRPEGEHIESDH